MEIYTIGFAGKSAATFFGLLREAKIGRLVDIRLNNTSQLAGFAKADSLPFFLREICSAEYVHELMLAPTEEMFADYKKDKGTWEALERVYLKLLKERQVERKLEQKAFEVRSVLLCSEATPDKCHRRLAAEYLKAHWKGVSINHL